MLLRPICVFTLFLDHTKNSIENAAWIMDDCPHLIMKHRRPHTSHTFSGILRLARHRCERFFVTYSLLLAKFKL